MSNFTKGPWGLEKFKRDEKYWVSVREDGLRKVIAELSFGYDEPYESQVHANAKLIEAAPELYEALEALLNCPCNQYGEDSIYGIAIKKARAALAKAKGDIL